MTPRLYFAYGSNMDPRQMRARCPGAVAMGRATLGGFRFLINRRGVATIERHRRCSVMGVLWDLSPRCEAALDRFEGVDWGIYRKEEVVVRDGAGWDFPALVYIDPERRRGIPRAGYLEKILLGASLAGIPTDTFAAHLDRRPRHAA